MGNVIDPIEPYIAAERAADFLSLSRKTLLKLARKGKVPAHPVGEGRRKLWRFRLSELDRWIRTEVTLSSDQGRCRERKLP